MIIYYEKINNFTVSLYFPQNHFTHHWSYAGYTTTLILNINYLAYFLWLFIMKQN